MLVTNNLPQIQSAPYVIVTNGANRFTLYSNFLPIDRCGEGDVAGDVEVVGEGAAVYLFGQAAATPEARAATPEAAALTPPLTPTAVLTRTSSCAGLKGFGPEALIRSLMTHGGGRREN